MRWSIAGDDASRAKRETLLEFVKRSAVRFVVPEHGTGVAPRRSLPPSPSVGPCVTADNGVSLAGPVVGRRAVIVGNC